ncbi:hypothetical protein PVBG_05582 [Plasmodium vivax Brazil I]|uniref:VIR protein n=1 Tax=Plasmodium vivax (strain Brazil I) TaxID=1033975 RepID=A0A0J9SKA4_PLAV1|nr:hypothetical protein PVBG_05582 [Plasmodium vivax Brazil I]
MLQKEVEVNLKHNYDSNMFKKFQNFLIKYGEIFPEKQGRCTYKIEPIDEITFNKMHALHQLYDKYEKYSRYITGTMHTACGDFYLFTKEYNDYIINNKSESEFFNRILQNISKRVEKTFLDFRLQCSQYTFDLVSPKLHEPEPVNKFESHSPTQRDKTELPSGGATSQTPSHEALERANTQLPQEETELSSIPKETIKPERLEENNNHGGNEDNAMHYHRSQDNTMHYHRSQDNAKHYHRRENNAITEIPPRFQPHHVVFDSLRTQSQPQHQEYIESQESLNEPARDSSTIIGSITNVLKEVDPVPVVGVSGGMGALFLLLRYTPVGAFFRGGRGRVRRIPSGFHGPFPGEFPNFQDYEGGYIGYGPMSMNPLAE